MLTAMSVVYKEKGLKGFTIGLEGHRDLPQIKHISADVT